MVTVSGQPARSDHVPRSQIPVAVGAPKLSKTLAVTVVALLNAIIRPTLRNTALKKDIVIDVAGPGHAQTQAVKDNLVIKIVINNPVYLVSGVSLKYSKIKRLIKGPFQYNRVAVEVAHVYRKPARVAHTGNTQCV